MSYQDNDDRIWCECAGTLFMDTGKAIGIERPGEDKALWIPHSHLGAINYVEGGDSEEITQGEDIIAVEVSPWMAKQKGLQPSEDVVKPKGTPRRAEENIPF